MMDDDKFSSLLQHLCSEGKLHSETVRDLHAISRSSEIRDYDWSTASADPSLSADIYEGVWISLNKLWSSIALDQDASYMHNEHKVLDVWNYISTLPEYDHSLAACKSSLSQLFVQKLFKRIVTLPTSPQSFLAWKKTLSILKHLLHWIYSHKVNMRPYIRSQFGKHLLAVYADRGSSSSSPTGVGFNGRGSDAGNNRAHVAHLLEVLGTIIGGLDGVHSRAQSICAQELLSQVIMPLHTPNEMIEWRDQIPVLQCYHEPLVRCLVKLIEQDRGKDSVQHPHQQQQQHLLHGTNDTLLVQAIKMLLKLWPDAYQTNTPKQVLLLHELEMLLELMTRAEFTVIVQPLMVRLTKCFGTDSDNIRPAQRALQFFKSEKILDLFVPKRGVAATEHDHKGHHSTAHPHVQTDATTEKVMCALLPALYREGKLSWNPTVNKMTALALRSIKERDEPMFKKFASQLFGASSSKTVDSHAFVMPTGRVKPQTTASQPVLPTAETRSEAQAKKHLSAPPLGKMPLPPRAVNISSAVRPPPMAVMRGQAHNQAVGSSSSSCSGAAGAGFKQYSAANPPPVTITGVAPWAKQVPTSTSAGDSGLGALHSRAAEPKSGVMSKLPRSHAQTLLEQHREEKEKQQQQAELAGSAADDGFEALLQYIQLCLPGGDSDGKGSPSDNDWNVSQAAQTPTLLPSLKFHDLVFGGHLGEGAFSVVKYARHITKGKSQSSWPEYAVKIVTSSKIQEFQYLSSVVREMAVLQMLSHPGIARLVSTFRYKDSAYLVLEYAAKGDLHTYLLNYGRLNHLHTRFVVGEVLAALLTVHELGFTFNDLKPENIIITDILHIKIADFGACRPVTESARELLTQSKSILSNMRDGDWREQTASEATSQGQGADEKETDMFRESDLSDLFRDDKRIEGTPAYLPPEVLSGRSSLESFSADPWALGCVAHFCLFGKPLYFGDREEVLEQILVSAQEQSHKVHFAESITTTSNDGDDDVDDDKQTAGGAELMVAESAAAESFITSLTNREPSQRLSLQGACQHPYLTVGYTSETPLSTSNLPPAMNPLALHSETPFPLPMKNKRVADGRSSSGSGDNDEQWSRRQFSRLWAPMPAEYAMDLDDSTSAHGKASGESSAADLWLMVHPHRFTLIAESEVEKGSSFLVFRDPNKKVLSEIAEGNHK